jgi:hypothetical protein
MARVGGYTSASDARSAAAHVRGSGQQRSRTCADTLASAHGCKHASPPPEVTHKQRPANGFTLRHAFALWVFAHQYANMNTEYIAPFRVRSSIRKHEYRIHCAFSCSLINTQRAAVRGTSVLTAHVAAPHPPPSEPSRGSFKPRLTHIRHVCPVSIQATTHPRASRACSAPAWRRSRMRLRGRPRPTAQSSAAPRLRPLACAAPRLCGAAPWSGARPGGRGCWAGRGGGRRRRASLGGGGSERGAVVGWVRGWGWRGGWAERRPLPCQVTASGSRGLLHVGQPHRRPLGAGGSAGHGWAAPAAGKREAG